MALVIAVGGCITADAARPAERAAAADGFIEIASCDLDHDRYFETLRIVGDARFRQLLLVVEHGPVAMREVTVTFRDGGDFGPRTRASFASDTTSRVIDLPDAPRAIDDVLVDIGPHAAEVRVELWAR